MNAKTLSATMGLGFLLAVLGVPATLGAQAVIGVPPELTVRSEKGAVLTITDVRVGTIKVNAARECEACSHFTKDSAGNPAHWMVTTWDVLEDAPVPLRVGERFGYSFTLPRIEADDAIVITVRVEHPTAVTKDGRDRTMVEVPVTFRHNASDEPRYVGWEFREESPEYHQPGTWTVALYNKGRLLASKGFLVRD